MHPVEKPTGCVFLGYRQTSLGNSKATYIYVRWNVMSRCSRAMGSTRATLFANCFARRRLKPIARFHDCVATMLIASVRPLKIYDTMLGIEVCTQYHATLIRRGTKLVVFLWKVIKNIRIFLLYMYQCYEFSYNFTMENYLYKNVLHQLKIFKIISY